jgi:N-methylhydantoinase A
MATRIGVDVGGTFSDLVFYDEESKRMRVGKVLSTPEAPERGVLEVVAGTIAPPELARGRYFLHGTTVGLNALLERRGPRLGLVATRGFTDVLEIRRGDRLSAYDPTWKPSPPLVPRSLRLAVTERILADGSVLVPLVRDDVEAALERLLEQGVDAIAIAFLNAYANPAHERLARDILRERGFDGDLSLSSDVSREYREYERTSTTVIDVFVRPKVVHYLRRLEAGLAERGFDGTALITRSGGGSLTFAEAGERPVETVNSGPVAGVVGAAELCRTIDIAMAITADVGGTSFDTALVVDARPHVRHDGEIGDLPVQTTWVDVRSIGAGGGSIAFAAPGGILRVGPHSAGASPGPACYGRGGKEPTVTDCAVLLGMLPVAGLAGGIQLDEAAAERATAGLRETLGLSTEEVARGVLRISAASMAEAIRSISLEQGHDPREATLIPFGGAGPLFATLLCDELDLDRVVVPPFPGNFSAWGMLHQDLEQSRAVTVLLPLDVGGLVRAGGVLDEIQLDLRDAASSAVDQLDVADTAALDLRYQGQEYTLTVPLALGNGAPSVDAVHRDFSDQYRRTFGHTLGAAVEIVTVRAARRRLLPRIEALSEEAQPVASRATTAWSFTRDERLTFAIRARSSLVAGEVVAGPAVIVEDTATTYVDAGFTASPHEAGTLLIVREQEA